MDSSQNTEPTSTDSQTPSQPPETTPEKKCFIIMPISDMEPYPAGHFKRVYEHIIKPACQRAGFTPIRADDVKQANHIVIDVLRCLLEMEMVVCDLSGRNPNVFYELGVRHSFNKPVVLMKDKVTPRVFDIQGLRDVEYDENLRVDDVEIAVQAVQEAIEHTSTMDSGEDGLQFNSIIQLLGIKPAAIPKTVEISKDTDIILRAIKSVGQRVTDIESTIKKPEDFEDIFDDDSYIVPLTKVDTDIFQVGNKVLHPNFGAGEILDRGGSGSSAWARVDFGKHQKKIALAFAPLTKLNS